MTLLISKIGFNVENIKIGPTMIKIKIKTEQQPKENFSNKSLEVPYYFLMKFFFFNEVLPYLCSFLTSISALVLYKLQ